MALKQTWITFQVMIKKCFYTMIFLTLLHVLDLNEKFGATATQVITSCDFDHGLCIDWQQSTSDVFDWTLHSGQTLTLFTGPDGDHTTGGGFFMYIETSTPRVAGENAKLELSVPGNGEVSCLTFYYHMFGELGMGTLNVFSGNDLVFSATGNHGNFWREAKKTISLTNTVTFEGIKDGLEGDLAIDDVSITSGSCIASISCDFDRDICDGWQQSTSDDFDWKPHTGSTPTAKTGPNGDHTSGSGYYMYIETSSPRVAGDNAKFKLSVSGNGELSCLLFYYHMYGATTGTLTVYSGNLTVFNETGPHGFTWIEVKRTIYLDHTVTFEGIRGSSYTGDLAVDDVSITSGSCPDVRTSCDFDNGLCNGWRQSTSDVFDWASTKGTTPSNDTGPDYDHTSGSGYYMYIESSSPQVADDNAKLEIPVSGNGELSCLTFYYHMYGETVGTLTVYNENSVVFSKSGDHGKQWMKAEITIRVYNTVTFEGIRGSSYTGDLAIDDVSINTSASCPGYTETILAPTTSISSEQSTLAFSTLPSLSLDPSTSTVKPSLSSSTSTAPMSSGTSTSNTFTVKFSLPLGPTSSSSPSKTSISTSLSTPAPPSPSLSLPGTPTDPPTTDKDTEASAEKSKKPSSIIIGASVGGVLLVIIGAAFLVAYKRRQRSKNQPTETPVDSYNNDAYCNIGSAEQTIKTENEYENVEDIKPKEKQQTTTNELHES